MSDNLNNSSNVFDRLSFAELEMYANNPDTSDDRPSIASMAREILMYRRLGTKTNATLNVVDAARQVMSDCFRSPEKVEALYHALAVYYHEDKQPTA